MAEEKKVTPVKEGEVDFSLFNNKNVLKWVGIVTGEIALIMIIVFVVVIPQWETTAKLRREYKNQQDLAAALVSKSEELDRFKNDFAPQRATLDQAMPSGKEVGLMLSSLREVADKSGASIVEYKLDPGQLEAGVQKGVKEEAMEVELQVTGDSASVERFLQLIDTSLPIKKIENLEVTSRIITSESGSTIDIPEVRLLLNIYYLTDTSKADAKVSLKALDATDEEVLGQLGRYQKVTVIKTSTGTGSGTIGNDNFFGL